MRDKDPDFTGLDDIIASQIEALILSFEKYLEGQEL